MSDFRKIVCLDMSSIFDTERNLGWKDAGTFLKNNFPDEHVTTKPKPKCNIITPSRYHYTTITPLYYHSET